LSLITGLLRRRRGPAGREERLDQVGQQDGHLAAVELDVSERHAHDHPPEGLRRHIRD
jgi:hypothetical protein